VADKLPIRGGEASTTAAFISICIPLFAAIFCSFLTKGYLLLSGLRCAVEIFFNFYFGGDISERCVATRNEAMTRNKTMYPEQLHKNCKFKTVIKAKLFYSYFICLDKKYNADYNL